MKTRHVFFVAVSLAIVLGLVLAGPALAKKGSKTFLGSDDAKEADEPQKYLPDYSKLVKGEDADWVFFAVPSLRSHNKVVVKPFQSNAFDTHKTDGKMAAEYAPDYMSQWLRRQGFEVVESGGSMVIYGNVFNAWEPSGAARFWGGWMANPGCGIEVIVKDAKGNILAYMRHKARGSTIRDAVENGLEEIAKAIANGR